MRKKPETLLLIAMSVFAVAGLAAKTIMEMQLEAHRPYIVDPALVEPGVDPVVLIEPIQVVEPTAAQSATAWFSSIRGYCNSVDVDTRLRWQPAPETEDGTMHEAACLALAGRVDQARDVIQELPEGRRYQAAGVVFNAGHPAADAGDELAAGPLMELVVEFWPNHYMALYHAGAAAYERGEYERAEGYLVAFLEEYQTEDGWRRNAEAMIAPHGR